MRAKPISLAALHRDIAAERASPASAIDEAVARIDEADGEIGAFVHRATAESLEQAKRAQGPMRGIALGVKDIFDTYDMPTEQGSPIFAGNRPRADAALVAMARANGAAVLGKTVTTAFASLDPAGTRNPHDLGHTPGGSSSGSAAAVAAGMVAGAFGSQTGGSVVRPAAYCGVAGFKPSFRLLPTVGVKTFSWSLDTAGLFAAGVADVALLAALLTGRALALDGNGAGSAPRIGLYRSEIDAAMEPAMEAALEAAAKSAEAAGATVCEIREPAALAAAREAHGDLQGFEAAHALMFERLHHRNALGVKLEAILDEGAAVTPERYDAVRRTARVGRKAATKLFETVDALLLASAPGPAPETLESTGDAIFNKLWTLTGNPCVNVPGLRAPGGLPLGVTVVTRFGRDHDALQIAAFLEKALLDVG